MEVHQRLWTSRSSSLRNARTNFHLVVNFERKSAIMGQATSASWYTFTHPESPDLSKTQSSDPMIGFPEGRKERKPPLTLDQMDNARIPLVHRDYCADKYLALQACVSRNFVLKTWACNEQWHHLEECNADDFVLRYKEYEREKRLLERARRNKSIEIE